MIWLKRVAVLVVSLVASFLIIMQSGNHVSAEHVITGAPFMACILYGLMSEVFGLKTQSGRYVYWTVFGTVTILFLIHECVLWPMNRCVICPY